ncbi:hypothetical protein [Actinomadura nitritigenes]|uniref:hypothetical protein n=1 Tax=Actinomadura nitritigenes TaxID=134602 RepID=UPI003D91AAE6
MLVLHLVNGWRCAGLRVEVQRLESVLSEYVQPGLDLLAEASVLASADLEAWRSWSRRRCR